MCSLKKLITLLFFLLFLFHKEENRNLCESEDDKAECIKEIEEAKASPVAEENPGE